MKGLTIHLKAFISITLAIAVMTLFSLRSFAAPEVSDKALEAIAAAWPVLQDTGALTVKGQVSVNGNSQQTGATVTSGSLIVTGSDSEAEVDLGPLGRIKIGDGTTVTITFGAGTVNVRSQCSKTEIRVTRGQVDVKSPKTESIPAGKDEDYSGGVDASTAGGTDFEIDCEGRRPGAAVYTPGLLGVLLLAGAGAAVALGIGLGDEESRVEPVSPIR
jgi:hypothetical protein